MKVLLVIHELGYRGGERFFSNLSKGLIEKGHDVFLLAARAKDNRKPFPIKVKIVQPPSIINSIFQNNLFFIFFSIPWTFLRIATILPLVDLVYVGGTFVSFWPAVLASRLFSKKVVWCVFDLTEVPAKTLWFGLWHRIFEVINRFVAKMVTAATTIDKTIAPIIRDYYGIKRVKTIVSGFDVQPFRGGNSSRLIKSNNLKGKKVIILVGAIHPLKNPELAIRVFSVVKKVRQRAILIFVGGGEEKYVEKLKKLARKKDVAKDIIFTGIVPENELKDYYKLADILLITGKIVGFTALEAISAGKMPIYHPSGQPLGAVLDDLDIGLTTESRSVSGYSRVILNYLERPARYRRKLLNDKKRVLSKFNLERFTNETLKFFQSD